MGVGVGVIANSEHHIDGLVLYCSNFIANVLELLQSCAKPSIFLMYSPNIVLIMTSL